MQKIDDWRIIYNNCPEEIYNIYYNTQDIESGLHLCKQHKEIRYHEIHFKSKYIDAVSMRQQLFVRRNKSISNFCKNALKVP